MLKLPKYYGLWFIEKNSSCKIFLNGVIFSKQMRFERVMIYPKAWIENGLDVETLHFGNVRKMTTLMASL